MDRWRGKVAVVTGASAGIGLQIAKTLVKEGVIVIGLARRKEKMIKEMEGTKGIENFHPYECDISKNDNVVKAFEYIESKFKTVHILINNAGIVKMNTVEGSDVEDLQQVVNINFMGSVYCSKQAIRLMKGNGHEAHIININSTAGHKVPNLRAVGVPVDLNLYPSTKFALRALSEVLTNELRGSPIRVTNLSPGYVETEIGSNSPTKNDENEQKIPILKSEDIANAIVYVLGTPPHVHVTELTLKPLGEIV